MFACMPLLGAHAKLSGFRQPQMGRFTGTKYSLVSSWNFLPFFPVESPLSFSTRIYASMYGYIFLLWFRVVFCRVVETHFPFGMHSCVCSRVYGCVTTSYVSVLVSIFSFVPHFVPVPWCVALHDCLWCVLVLSCAVWVVVVFSFSGVYVQNGRGNE